MRLKFPTANDASNAIGDGQETLLDIRKIYVQEKAYDYDRTKNILTLKLLVSIVIGRLTS
jgi:hypothetical protein